jgi:hypothetical protein
VFESNSAVTKIVNVFVNAAEGVSGYLIFLPLMVRAAIFFLEYPRIFDFVKIFRENKTIA